MNRTGFFAMSWTFDHCLPMKSLASLKELPTALTPLLMLSNAGFRARSHNHLPLSAIHPKTGLAYLSHSSLILPPTRPAPTLMNSQAGLILSVHILVALSPIHVKTGLT